MGRVRLKDRVFYHAVFENDDSYLQWHTNRKCAKLSFFKPYLEKCFFNMSVCCSGKLKCYVWELTSQSSQTAPMHLEKLIMLALFIMLRAVLLVGLSLWHIFSLLESVLLASGDFLGLGRHFCATAASTCLSKSPCWSASSSLGTQIRSL